MKRAPCIVALLIALFTRAHVQAEDRPPNILVLFIDDMGYADPSCFGNPLVKTPAIDALAADGIRLTNFYVNSPICSASRTALMTGQYPQRWRIHSYLESRRRNIERKMAHFLDPRAPTLARILKSGGYRTAHFGKWHLGGGRDIGEAPLPSEYGFDESYVSFEGLGDRVLWDTAERPNASRKLGRGKIDRAPKHRLTEIYVDKAIRFIERDPTRPFYVRVFPNDVHDAHRPADGRAEKWKNATKNPFERKFFAVLEELDRQIGRLIAHLDERGLSDDTLVIFTSDNGPTDWPSYYKKGYDPPGFTGPFFGRKWSLYEGGIRMPFIAKWPRRIAAGSLDETSVVAAIDLLPTICALSGQELPEGVSFDGVDRSEVLRGKPSPRPRPLFWEYGTLGSIQPGKAEHRSPSLAVRDGEWKLLVQPDGSRAQLFHLGRDPGERSNLASTEADRTQRLSRDLRSWWTELSRVYDAASDK